MHSKENSIVYIIISKFRYGGGVESVADFIHKFINVHMKRNTVGNYMIYKHYVKQNRGININNSFGDEISVYTPPVPVIDSLIYNIRYIFRVLKIMKNYPKAKIVIIANAEEGFGCLLLKMLLRQRIKYIHISHGLWRHVLSYRRRYEGLRFRILSLLVQPLLEFIENFPLRFADKVIAVSNNVRQDLINIYKIPTDKMTVIYNCIIDHFDEINKFKAKKALGFPHDKKILLMIGKDIFIKGIDIGIRVFKKINRNDVILIIVSNRRTTINKLLQKYDVDRERVILYSYLNKKRLNTLYSAADLLLFLSRYESFGLTPLEALFSGTLPIISRNCGVAEIFLLDKNLYETLTTPLNEDYIAKQVLNLLDMDYDTYFRIIRRTIHMIMKLSLISINKYKGVLTP